MAFRERVVSFFPVGIGAGFTDDFLDMMGDGGGLLKQPQSAYLKFSGDMLEAFMILTDSMYDKGDDPLVSYGKFNQTNKEAADELKETDDFAATELNTSLAKELNGNLNDMVKSNTPEKLKDAMKDVVEISSKYLAQNAEFSKDKGPAFQLLVKAMRAKNNEQLFQKGKLKKTYGNAATDLQKAKGLEHDHDDPNLSQEIHSNISRLMASGTPEDLKSDMEETLNISSKYLSQAAIDELERGPAFDILIKELEQNGGEQFTPEFQPLTTNHCAAYTLKSAPGLTAVTPDPSTSPIFASALHKAVDLITPKTLCTEMNEVIQRCANYLSAFVRDRDKAVESVIKMMKANPTKELAKRNDYKIDYNTGAAEVEKAPVFTPFLPVKDIAVEVKEKLTKDMEGITPPALKNAVKSAIQDISKFISQPIAMRSGVAGERYPLEFLASVKTSLGTRPLFRHQAYSQTYADGADVIKYAGPLEKEPKNENLQSEIVMEMKRGLPKRLGSSIVTNLKGIIEDASAHLANVGTEKGGALQHLIDKMKEKGKTPLGEMQGYQQSYSDGARRIENAPSLKNEKVDKNIYESVREKLTDLIQANPAPQHEKHMPGIVDESAKVLAAPFPENELEKRRLLADLMARQESEILGEQGIYKLTYKEGGDELIKGPAVEVSAADANARKQLYEKVNEVIPEKKLQTLLRPTAKGATSHLTNVIKGRGEAMQAIHDKMVEENEKEFLNIGEFSKTHQQAAEMLKQAPHFGDMHPSPVIEDRVSSLVKNLAITNVSQSAQPFVADAQAITTKYIAGKATKECGLDAKSLRALDDGGVASPPRPSPSPSRSPLQSRSGATDSSKERDRLKAEAERQDAMKILQSQLRAHGAETFYKQPQTELSHREASDWLLKPDTNVNQSVRDSGDTSRLHKKFEKRLGNLVEKKHPASLADTMQDVIIESARRLSEEFVANNYRALVRLLLISEMQKRGNEILIELDNATETYLFAAQRLKKASTMNDDEPCSRVSYVLAKKLDDIMKFRSMPRKLMSAMKDHIKEAADYLSTRVTQPDDEIEAYTSVIREMEAAGDSPMIQGDIPKTFTEAASYLRQLTTNEDEISLSNSALQSAIQNKLKNLMSNVEPIGYSQAVLMNVNSQLSKFLVSYIMLQGKKTEALKYLVERLDERGNDILLRHGKIHKTFKDGADALRSKNADQLGVSGGDPVAIRKIQIKLNNLIESNTPDKFKTLMPDVIEDATAYLAVNLLKPQIIQVCKCMKNVFVQCELWCEEILRRVGRPCCSCSRHISIPAIADLAPDERITTSGSSRAVALGMEISIKPCPTNISRVQERPTLGPPCPSKFPTEECKRSTTSYLLYSTTQPNAPKLGENHQRCLTQSALDSLKTSSIISESTESSSSMFAANTSNAILPTRNKNFLNLEELRQRTEPEKDTDSALQTTLPDSERRALFWQSKTALFTKAYSKNENLSTQLSNDPATMSRGKMTITGSKRGYTARAPIITTDQMADWQAMMSSLMWNIQAWRQWIQEIINQTTGVQYEENREGVFNETWSGFQRRMAIEALQWRQYNSFSRQLTLRLALRYRDRKIVSPTRATVKTEMYLRCQQEILDIIEMFNSWTHWITALLKETDLIEPREDTDMQQNELQWRFFKKKVEGRLDDWLRYNAYLDTFWENKYKTLFADWLPTQKHSVPVWVVSACGAVPSGAVAAGVFEDEVTWVARTTHNREVLPAALHPSKHCCVVYADGEIHHYTKYQVLCNADVKWVACRAGSVTGARAVSASRGVLVGRVLYRGTHLLGAVRSPAYRCHVVIFGRPFDFNCYELLILSDHD